ncbi:MAG: glycoside hydrolase family 15 protein [Candidatus Peregrinibacteria bacterium]|nr:glycoside hydrolase family 15 protein [Candidatus Peregrinibacteria bacterium]
MPRALVLGNGSILATFDRFLQLKDVYFPYVGMEDHTHFGDAHRIGFFVEGKGFSWISDGTWRIEPRYEQDTLVTHSHAVSETLGIALSVRDYVHPVHNVLIRHFAIRSIDGQAKRVRAFFHHDLHIYGDKQKDTAFYEPFTNSVIHFRQTRYFLIGGVTNRPTECTTGFQGGKYASVLRSREQLRTCGISSFTTGKTEYRGLEGTFRDAEDGELARNPIEQGSVDSTVAIHCDVPADTETEIDLWLCFGKTLDEVLTLQQTILTETPERLHRNCHNYWKSWVHKGLPSFGSLGSSVVDLYKRSLLIIRTHIDNGGGVIAAADADIMAFNRDTYTYVWPRDGAFVSLALDAAGYGEVTRRFFEFCAAVQMQDGYLLHKYNPDKSPGSSWHPWERDGEAQLPIQEDETALVLYALWKHFERTQDFEFLQRMYEKFVKRAAAFLCDFREETTGLPLPSYDLWEEHRGVFTYTTSCVIAGLHASARIAHILGHYKHSERFESVADEMRQALLFHLFDEGEQRFLKKIKRKDGVTVERDSTPDASIAAIWILEVLPANDPRVVSTMNALHDALSVRTDIGGLARYAIDHYHAAVPPSRDVPGNPWIITTLWEAQYAIALATTLQALEPAREALLWAVSCASESGILPEQVHPYTRDPLSVAPLTWSHATFVDTVLKFIRKEEQLREKAGKSAV